MGGEQFWPAPEGNPCSIFFLDVDFVFSWVGEGQQRLFCHCLATLLNHIEGCMGGGEQFWSAPEGNPCSIYFWVWT